MFSNDDEDDGWSSVFPRMTVRQSYGLQRCFARRRIHSFPVAQTMPLVSPFSNSRSRNLGTMVNKEVVCPKDISLLQECKRQTMQRWCRKIGDRASILQSSFVAGINRNGLTIIWKHTGLWLALVSSFLLEAFGQFWFSLLDRIFL